MPAFASRLRTAIEVDYCILPSATQSRLPCCAKDVVPVPEGTRVPGSCESDMAAEPREQSVMIWIREVKIDVRVRGC
jgi:hypothetical protein